MTFLALTLLTSDAKATEVDSFTDRYEYKKDGLSLVNEKTNELLDGVDQVLLKKEGCERSFLDKTLSNHTGGIFWSKIEKKLRGDPLLVQKKVEGSIFEDNPFYLGPVTKLVKLGPVFMVGDLRIGTDKLGHFFYNGYNYYNKIELQDTSIEETLKIADKTERRFFGGLTTGVYSYADLTANYDGYTFWKNLTKGDNALYQCEDNHWKRQKDFDWGEYIHAGWDEGINCSVYSGIITDIVREKINDMENQDPNNSYLCPIKQDLCEETKARYGEFADHLINCEFEKNLN